MKYRIFHTIVLFIFLISCSKQDDQPPVVVPVNSLSASIDGKIFYASDITTAVPNGSLSIRGIHNAGSSKEVTILLTLSHFAGPKAYPIDATTTASYSEPGATYHASSGNIIVTASDNKHIAGTFSFEASAGGNARNITNGKFDVYK